jgi:hypothetical protein
VCYHGRLWGTLPLDCYVLFWFCRLWHWSVFSWTLVFANMLDLPHVAFSCYKNSHLLQRVEKFASLWISRIQKTRKKISVEIHLPLHNAVSIGRVPTLSWDKWQWEIKHVGVLKQRTSFVFIKSLRYSGGGVLKLSVSPLPPSYQAAIKT